MTTIEKVMQLPVFVDRHITLKDAIKQMVSHDVCCLVVGEADKHYGVVSERMIIDAIAEDEQVLSEPVSELVKYQPVCIKKNQTIEDAVELMKQHKIRHLCVEDDAEIVGFLDARTIMANIA
jgi:CBS domain-containing protein